jgi:gas vesicle protein
MANGAPSGSRGLSLLSGLFFGGLAGAACALLLAPRPGAETRRLIRSQAEALRDQANHTLDEARAGAEKAVHDAAAEVERLQQRGRSLVRRNVNRVQETAAAVKATAQAAWQANDVPPAAQPTR